MANVFIPGNENSPTHSGGSELMGGSSSMRLPGTGQGPMTGNRTVKALSKMRKRGRRRGSTQKMSRG